MQRVESIDELGKLCDVCGGLVPIWAAAVAGGVSRPRMVALVEQGRFPAFRFYGCTFVGLAAVRKWARSESRLRQRKVTNPHLPGLRSGVR